MPEEQQTQAVVPAQKSPQEIERWNAAAAELGLPSTDALAVLKKFVSEIQGSVFLPQGLGDHPANLLGVILRGREMGLAPMESLGLFWIEPKSRRLCMYADAMMAIMRRAGFKFPVKEFTNDHARLQAVRPDGEDHEAEFTMDDAKRAELYQKDNWRKYPKAMLKARVIGEIWRVLAVDKGGGQIYTREEMEDAAMANGSTVVTATVEPPNPYAGGRLQQPVIEPKPEPAPPSAPPVPDQPATAAPAPPAAAPVAAPPPSTPAPVATEPPAVPAAPAAPTLEARMATLRRKMAGESEDPATGAINKTAQGRLTAAFRGWFLGYPAPAQKRLTKDMDYDSALTAIESLLATSPGALDDAGHPAVQVGAELRAAHAAAQPDALDAYMAVWPDDFRKLARTAQKARKLTASEMAEWFAALDLNAHKPDETAAFLTLAALPGVDAHLLFDIQETSGRAPMLVVAEMVKVAGGRPLAEIPAEEINQALGLLAKEPEPAEEDALFAR